MIPDLKIEVVRVGPVEVPLPRYQTAGSAGMDLLAALEKPMRIKPMERVMVPTGLCFAIPPKFEGQVRARSGLAAQHGLTTVNSPATIDSDYRGEVKVLLINLGNKTVAISPLDRIAQMVIAPVAWAELILTTSLSETARGKGGFGSTGVAHQ